MNIFSLIYPCETLAKKLDPLLQAISMASDGDLPALQTVFRVFSFEVGKLMGSITAPFLSRAGRVDERWYWVALAALDYRYSRRAMQKWFACTENGESWLSLARAAGETDGRFGRHIREFQNAFAKPGDMGRPPEDLVAVIASIALASPAVVALRAFRRVTRIRGSSTPGLLHAAARVAMGYRNLFNQPETMAMVRSLQRDKNEQHYWRAVLGYCGEGNLQAVMDEYVHMLWDSLGPAGEDVGRAAAEMAGVIERTVSLRAVNLDFDEIATGADGDKYDLVRHSIRCRFAMRFGDGKSEEDSREVRKDHVRNAFNSPFRPFVLATTSIGQEGLDFHHYCHEIYHWNLPSNPVDLEQREGRIHRYKGHVIRRNIASAFTLQSLQENASAVNDPWQLLFEMAQKARPESSNDLIPFWIYEGQGGFRIKRYIPLLPLSREWEQLDHLLGNLAAYRLVMGQPRQEDLVHFLQNRLACGETGPDLDKLRIDLRPG